MKKIFVLFILAFALITLFGCQAYVNSHVATFMNTSSFGDEASIEFDSFKGSYSLKLRRDGAPESTLEIEASLVEGEMNIYIGVDGEKELLLTLYGGESIDKTVTLDKKYENEKTVYVILEANEKCFDGDFEFEYN